MSKIVITNMELFRELLSSTNKIVEFCKVDINSKNCIIMLKNKSRTVRAYFESNAIISDEPVTFCLGDIRKLYQSIATLTEFKEDSTKPVLMKYEYPFLSCKDTVKFKIRTVNEKIVEDSITTPLKVELIEDFKFTIKNALIKKMLSMSFITSAETPKIYIYKENDKIIGEIDEKNVKSAVTDTIAIPISNEFTGSWDSTLVTNLERLRLWNIFGLDEVDIIKTKNGPLQVETKKEIDNKYIKLKLISSLLKS